MILRILTPVWGLYAILVLSGCSIAMALSGNKQPNFDYIVVGAARTQVEVEFGHPTATNDLTYGKQEATYKYEMGNSPNPGRAWVNFYVDLATIGLAEPILSIIELLQGHDEETRIVYGAENKVLEIHGYTPPPVPKVVMESEEAQEKYIERRRKAMSAPDSQSSPPPAQ
jgi:hypothetical protein